MAFAKPIRAGAPIQATAPSISQSRSDVVALILATSTMPKFPVMEAIRAGAISSEAEALSMAKRNVELLKEQELLGMDFAVGCERQLCYRRMLAYK